MRNGTAFESHTPPTDGHESRRDVSAAGVQHGRDGSSKSPSRSWGLWLDYDLAVAAAANISPAVVPRAPVGDLRRAYGAKL